MSDPVDLYIGGRISPPVLLARLLLTGASGEDVRDTLSRRPETASLLPFFEAHAAAVERIRSMLEIVDHANATDVAGIAAQFDAAVSMAPEASVAAYSLDDQVLLAEATAELVEWLVSQRLFAPGADVIDLGCGFGRVSAALAPFANSVLGLDVSAGMIAEARRRYAGCRNALFEVTDGLGLRSRPTGTCDLVLAVDCFPYLFQAGVARAHLVDSARVLRPRGALVVLNLSYGPDQAMDHRNALQWAAEADLRVEQDGDKPFTLWDAKAYVLRAVAELGSGA